MKIGCYLYYELGHVTHGAGRVVLRRGVLRSVAAASRSTSYWSREVRGEHSLFIG